MTILADIQDALRSRRYRLSIHGAEEMMADAVSETELLGSVLAGEIIEDYPQAFPWPACLVLGHLDDAPVHSVWAFDARTRYTVLVTAYLPDPDRWTSDFRKRLTT